MMFNYPPFGFSNFGMNPFYNLRRQGGFYYQKPPVADFRKTPSSVNNVHPDSNLVEHNNLNKGSIENDNHSDSCSSYDDSVFEVFGFKLHSDDLLIIALLFFLYKERR